MVLTFLDKHAAFDSTQKDQILHKAFLASNCTPSQSLWYMALRLQSRLMFLDDQSSLIGPIHGGQGLEQWGILSS